MKKGLLLIVVLFAVVTLSACAPKVNRELGQLNLNYNAGKDGLEKNNLSIAIVDPQYSTSNQEQKIQGNPLLQLLAGKDSFKSPDFNSLFYQQYKQELSRAFSNSFQEMLTQKGFNLLGPYNTFEDMTYGDKKKGYLALVPSMNVSILKKPNDVSTSFFTGITTEKGVIQVGGELKIDLVEPLTNEKIMTRRINLSDFDIKSDYVLQQKTQSGFTIIGNIAASFSTCKDSTDKAMTEVLNAFFNDSVTKIDKFISSEEIISFNKQIDGLKNLKRF